jgi:hypothetical protein
LRGAVANEIVDAILKTRRDSETGVTYRSKDEQEKRLEKMFAKWLEKGTVWSKAAFKVRISPISAPTSSLNDVAQVHEDQLNHVKKGCLARPRDDITSDGSRIKNVHRHMNNLNRGSASGIEMQSGMMHDFVLRRDIRITLASETAPTPFDLSTCGSHHACSDGRHHRLTIQHYP